jgi:hypothetical protein
MQQDLPPLTTPPEEIHKPTRVLLRGLDHHKYVSFALRFERTFGPDVMNLIKKFLSEQVFLFHPAKALFLRAAMRMSLFQQEQLVIVDVESDWVLRIRDATGHCALTVDLAAVLDPAREHPNYMWTLVEADIQLAEGDIMSSSCVVHSGYIRPFEGEMWLHIRDPERGACFEVKVCRNFRRIAWPPRACMEC